MLFVRHLLTVMFTQRSNYIGRLQTDKCTNLLICKYKMLHISWFVIYMNRYILKTMYHPTLESDFSSSCTGKSQPKNTHISLKKETILTDLNRHMVKTLHLYVCAYVCMCACMCTCMYVCMYVYMYVCVDDP